MFDILKLKENERERKGTCTAFLYLDARYSCSFTRTWRKSSTRKVA